LKIADLERVIEDLKESTNHQLKPDCSASNSDDHLVSALKHQNELQAKTIEGLEAEVAEVGHANVLCLILNNGVRRLLLV
jgi:hypothetical protein